MVDTPDWLRPIINTIYPPSNTIEFERWFYDNYNKDVGVRHYLPVFWTGYQVNNNYGNDEIAMSKLQQFIDDLDKSKSYFTICQYDDLCGVDFKGLDVRVYGMSQRLCTQKIDVVIPLIGIPYPNKYTLPKKYKASFVGCITHPIRRKMIDELSGKDGYHITTEHMGQEEYNMLLSQSVFALCPRGYAKTSFRTFEAMRQGAIPVVISDLFLEPMNIPTNSYGVKIENCKISLLDDIINSIQPIEIEKLKKNSLELIKNLFNYKECKDWIIKVETTDL